MVKFVFMFIGAWIVAIPIFLLFGAEPRDIFNIFIAAILAYVLFGIYTTIQRKRVRQ